MIHEGVKFMKVLDEQKITAVLDYIKDFQKKEGRSPSFRQIKNACGFNHISVAQRYVYKLVSRGQITQDKLGQISTPTNLRKGQTVVAPLVGQIACGTPIFAEENIEGTYQLPAEIFGSEKVMMLRACGDSMKGVGIYNGDLIVATISNEAKNGDIVVALINDSATVKRLIKKNGYAILHPENPDFDDIITKELTIQGVVKHVIHSF